MKSKTKRATKPRETEAQFQRAVVGLARASGWRVFHARAARTAKGWATPVQYDGAGFCDLVLAHRKFGVLFLELKSADGGATAAQVEWIATLQAAGARALIVRPSQWAMIEAMLKPAPQVIWRADEVFEP